ncbi:LysR family transcriptional regulator [Tabrizicola sp. BL-A-41-H6]|uniref:LysR family transcriptional regulator n=1 Tax=Tabrizicola sp. BL-A-41-H6 TaxID=3421107 RepID=UPI003D669A59
MLNLRHLVTFVGVYEERSFSKAAKRLHATQSGLSMQTQHLEESIGLSLFDRSARGVTPTFAGDRLYELSVEVIRRLDEIDADIRVLKTGVGGELSVGLMPTFTRAVLAPTLGAFIAEYPTVRVSVVEAYSAALTEGVAAGTYDFAIVPRAPHRDGIRTHLLGSDREILVCKPGSGLTHLAPVRLADLPPLKLVLPGRGNARREAFENYAELHGIRIATILNMDAMIATLEFVSHSDFVTILPETICVNDLDGTVRSLHPIIDPTLTVDYVVIEPAKAAMPKAAALFLEGIETQYRKLKELWLATGAMAAELDHHKD